MPGVEGGKEGDCQEGYSFQRAEHESAERVIFFFIFFFNITEHRDVLKTTTDETSLLQACVYFINQAARSHYFLTEKLPAETAVMLF